MIQGYSVNFYSAIIEENSCLKDSDANDSVQVKYGYNQGIHGLLMINRKIP